MSIRDDILALRKQETMPFPTPEAPHLEGKVFLRTISSAEKGRIAKLGAYTASGDFDLEKGPSAACVMYLSDSEGNRIFSDDDVAEVGSLPPSLVERAFIEGRKFNGDSEESIEESEKNSASAQINDSGTS